MIRNFARERLTRLSVKTLDQVFGGFFAAASRFFTASVAFAFVDKLDSLWFLFPG